MNRANGEGCELLPNTISSSASVNGDPATRLRCAASLAAARAAGMLWDALNCAPPRGLPHLSPCEVQFALIASMRR